MEGGDAGAGGGEAGDGAEVGAGAAGPLPPAAETALPPCPTTCPHKNKQQQHSVTMCQVTVTENISGGACRCKSPSRRHTHRTPTDRHLTLRRLYRGRIISTLSIIYPMRTRQISARCFDMRHTCSPYVSGYLMILLLMIM